MTVAELNAELRKIGSGIPEIERLCALFEKHSHHEVDVLFDKLAKVTTPKPKAPRKPRKSAEEIAAEKEAKEKEKQRKAEEKKQKAAEAANAKAAKKLKEYQEKAAKKAEQERLKQEAAERPVKEAVLAIEGIQERFREGNVPESAVNAALDTLTPLKGAQLYGVAQALNAAAGLTPKSTKPKILKQIREMVLRVWKMSDSVNN
jgi:flagellar biosynthesis GTPase FlhF